MKKTDYFQTDDGVGIAFHCWLPEEEPIAVLQIAHGMAEHALRYEDFALFLNKHRIAVYANDHRGHGMTAADPGNLGFFAEKNGWIKVVTDMRSVTKIIQKDYPHIPVFLFGHSMGSFLARTYITLYDDVHGLILSGTAAQPPLMIKTARALGFFHRLRYGAKTPSAFFDKLSFGSFNKPYESDGLFSWLSRDKQVVQKYRDDPYCGFICSVAFFQDLFYGLDYISKKEHNQWIRFTLPVYIVSGGEDPVGDLGKGPEKVARLYLDCQLEDITVNIFKDARHEILNETNREEVYKDILEWITYHN